MKNLKKGFTLIELLVVIAIIGILSSIVLGSLSSARTKSEDSAIQATLANMRAQAELYYANYNEYSTAAGCATAASIFASATSTGSLKNLVDGLSTRAGAGNFGCVANGTNWVVAAKLKGTGAHCVDSTGASRASTTAATASSTITGSACN